MTRHMRVRSTATILFGALCFAPLALTLAPRAQERVDYERQIKPILEQTCYECHGQTKGRGQLRLHDRMLAMKGGLSGPAIIPGKPDESVLVHRVLGLGDDDRMPLKKDPLSDEQIALIKAWIAQGADWPGSTPAPATSTGAAASVAAASVNSAPPQHWSYVKPRRPDPPIVKHTDWARNPIDRFVLARLEQEGLAPSHEAAKTTLLRRVSLDLIGLPPTIAEQDAFLADTRPDAYERLVDRLLASPRYGERWARPWLDLARYADSNGYEKDNVRSAWKFRDWVIDALNADMPFDRFTIEQLAGDMLPDASTSQKIASGFHRNAMTNEEGGVDPDESLFDVLVDRVNTTSSVWLGSTIGCAQCHNHKYDPFSQKDYYRLMAFFQNTDYTSRTFGDGTRYFEGKLDLATPDQEKQRAALEQEIASREGSLARVTPALTAAQAQWERRQRDLASTWTPLTPEHADATNDVQLTIEADNTIIASGPNPAQTTYTIVATTPLTDITALRLEALPDPRLPKRGPGRDPYGHFRLTGMSVEIEPARLAAPASSSAAAPRRAATRTSGRRRTAGTGARFAVSHHAVSHHAASPADTTAPGRITFTQVKTDDAVQQVDPEMFLSPDAMRSASRTSWTIDAMRDDSRVTRQAVLTAERPFGFASGTRFTIRLAHLDGTLGQGLGRFRLSVTRAAKPAEVAALQARLRATLAIPVAKRTEKQASDLGTQFRRETPLLARERDALKASRDALIALRIPTTLVMREKASFERPSTHLRERGAFNAKGELLYAAVPAALNPMPDSQPMNRLGLARWLVSPDNPLTARVAVNRLWEQLFGRGLVETSEDFGTQGAEPSHAALLDWLAVEFMETHRWSQKAMLRAIVTSATYRQDSRVTPALLERDPYNRLLARGARFRLEAEMIRDTALASAGLLSARMHGPSVFPPQPEGIWNNPYSSEKWQSSEGEDRYRRAIYTFIRRTSPYPTMMAFDATSREFCTVRRVRTNTPLQALALLNDEVFVEAARAVASRVVREVGTATSGTDLTDARLTHAMRLIVSRAPEAGELARLRALLDAQTRYYQAHPQDAQRLAADAASDAPARAAWIIVSNVLLNLDELQTRE